MLESKINQRSVPYPGIGATVCVPAEQWLRTIATAREYGKNNSEALILWGGVVSGKDVVVTGLYIPQHSAQGYRVALNSDESRWLIRQLRERDEKLLAQVHSHPCEAFHSAGDDERAASFHAGYISIVIPRFGRRVARPTDCAIFEYDGSRFIQLKRAEVASRIVTVTNCKVLKDTIYYVRKRYTDS